LLSDGGTAPAQAPLEECLIPFGPTVRDQLVSSSGCFTNLLMEEVFPAVVK